MVKNFKEDKINNIINWLLWLLLATLAALMPLAISLSTASIFYLPKMVIACWLLAIFYVLWSIRLLVLPDQKISFGYIYILLAAFALFVVLSTLLSHHRYTALWGNYGRFEGFFAITLYIAVFLAAANLRWDKQRLSFLIKTLVIVAAIIALYALIQSAGYDFISWRVLKFETGRAYANFGNPVLLGSYLVMMLPLALVLTFLEKQKTKRWLWLGFDILIFGGLLASITRGAWLAAVIGYVVIIWTALRRKLVSWQRLALISSIFLISIITIGLLIIGKGKSGNILVNKIVSVTQPERGTIHSRIEIWKGAVKVIGSRPFLGYGPDNFPWVYPRFQTLKSATINGHRWRTDNAHNWLLQSAATLGLPAAIILTFIIFWVIYHSMALNNNRIDGGIDSMLFSIGAALLSYFISLLSAISVFGSTVIFWLLAGVVASFTLTRKSLNGQKGKYLSGGVLSVIALYLLVLAFAFSSRYLADAMFLKGYNYYNAGYSNATLLTLDRAIRLSPHQYYYYMGMGKAEIHFYQKNGNSNYLNKAITDLSKAVDLNPYDIKNYLLLAQAYDLAGMFGDSRFQSKAKDVLESAKKIAPRSAEILFRLGEANFRLGDLKEAELNLKQSIAIFPNEASVYVILGALYERKNLVKKARKSYLTAIKINPDDVSAMDARIRLKRLNE